MTASIQQIIRVQGLVAWRVSQDAKSGLWIGVCDALRMTAEGETWSDLMETIGEILAGAFSEMLKTGDLDQFLREHGWQVAGGLPARQDNLRFDIPYFVQQAGRDSEAAIH